MTDNVPAWAWDLLIAALDYEDVHHVDHPCMSSVLSAIPVEVRYTARAIDQYQRDTRQRAEASVREAIAAQLDQAAEDDKRQHLERSNDRGMLIATWQAAAEIARGGSDA